MEAFAKTEGILGAKRVAYTIFHTDSIKAGTLLAYSRPTTGGEGSSTGSKPAGARTSAE